MFINVYNPIIDVQIWDNYDGTIKVSPYSEKARGIFMRQFGVAFFRIRESDLLRVVLLCASNGLVIDSILDAGLRTLMDVEGNKIDDPKLVAYDKMIKDMAENK